MGIELREVSPNDGEDTLEMLLEFPPEENILNSPEPLTRKNFRAYLQRVADMSEGKGIDLARFVPQTTYWLYVDGHPVGRGRLRHRLNDWLRQSGGHIGYAIRPSNAAKATVP